MSEIEVVGAEMGHESGTLRDPADPSHSDLTLTS